MVKCIWQRQGKGGRPPSESAHMWCSDIQEAHYAWRSHGSLRTPAASVFRDKTSQWCWHSSPCNSPLLGDGTQQELMPRWFVRWEQLGPHRCIHLKGDNIGPVNMYATCTREMDAWLYQGAYINAGSLVMLCTWSKCASHNDMVSGIQQSQVTWLAHL